jgi:predicted enzyme related to lactoylglutathione lyase
MSIKKSVSSIKKEMDTALHWFEIPVSDLERAVSFYENVLSIVLERFTIPNGPEMALFPVEEKDGGTGGALICFPDFYYPGNKGPLIYLNANPDLQNALTQVEINGGKIIIAKRMITEERGFMAIIQDTEGNRIALHSDQ